MSNRSASRMLAYKITLTHDASKHPVGQVFLDERWLGHRYESQRYNPESLCFEPLFTARYLGRITARTEHGKVRQLLSLRGMARARKKAQTRMRR